MIKTSPSLSLLFASGDAGLVALANSRV